MNSKVIMLLAFVGLVVHGAKGSYCAAAAPLSTSDVAADYATSQINRKPALAQDRVLSGARHETVATEPVVAVKPANMPTKIMPAGAGGVKNNPGVVVIDLRDQMQQPAAIAGIADAKGAPGSSVDIHENMLNIKDNNATIEVQAERIILNFNISYICSQCAAEQSFNSTPAVNYLSATTIHSELHPILQGVFSNAVLPGAYDNKPPVAKTGEQVVPVTKAAPKAAPKAALAPKASSKQAALKPVPASQKKPPVVAPATLAPVVVDRSLVTEEEWLLPELMTASTPTLVPII